MYNPEDLRSLTIKPKINDIDLPILKDFYTMYLMPFIYTYSITDADSNRQLQLRFDNVRFCHLLGLESIAKGHVKYNELSQYKGEKGWNNIEAGNLAFKHLKTLNQKKFKSIKAKFVYFYLIPDLLDKPLGVMFDKNNVNPPVQIESEILFYSSYENAVIHLGIDKEDNSVFYYPRTFFVEKLGKDNVTDKYTINQPSIAVKKEYRTITI
mgnify:FL=1|jgi:hypothetical protein